MRYRAPARAAQQAARSMVREVREGFGYLLHHRGLRANTVLVVAAVAGLGASYPLTFFFAVTVLGGGTRAFGIMEAVIGVGFLVGSLAVAALATRVRKGLAITIGLAVMGACLAAVSVTDAVWQACIPFVVLGAANAAALISVDTYFQEVVPEHLRGRVWGVRFTLTQGTYAVSVLAGAALAGVFDVRTLFIASGALVALPAIAGLFVRDIRDA
jgi:MFS family permease